MVDFSESQDRARALHRTRTRLAREMTEIVRDPAKYNNADVLDWINDRSKRSGLKMTTARDAANNNMVHIFVHDPRTETEDRRAIFDNMQYLGWVERRNEPTPDRS